MWKKILLIIGLIVAMYVQVNAQGVYLGPQLGYQRATDADQGNLMGGVAWRFKLTPSFGLEASINYRQETYANDALTVRNWPIMVTGLFYPLPIIYGAIGAGWYSVTFDYNQDKIPLAQDETTQEFGWHFGGGVELPISPSFIVTSDIRYVFLNYNFDEIPGVGDMNSNFFIITAGLLFNL